MLASESSVWAERALFAITIAIEKMIFAMN